MPAKADQTNDERLAAVRLKREEIALELETHELGKLMAERLQRQQDMQRQRETIEQSERDVAYRQSICSHMKGGIGVAGMNDGDDTKYAVIKHTLIEGTVMVICQRCQRPWMPPPRDLKKTAPSEFRRLDREYQEALRFPTDNRPSGKMLFSITYGTA